MFLDTFRRPEAWIGLATLTGLEIVLGIDNIVVLSIVTSRLAPSKRPLARRLGLFLALFFRIGLLSALTWVMTLTKPLFTLVRPISGRDLILLVGGMFLIAKSTHEIHQQFEGEQSDEPGAPTRKMPSFFSILVQIILLDIVFSLDSIITAVGMSSDLTVMICAVIIAVFIMIGFANIVGDFVNDHPTVKTLALSFLILIGVLLMADGMGQHVSKGYVYFAMAFSLLVELLNIRITRRRKT